MRREKKAAAREQTKGTGIERKSGKRKLKPTQGKGQL